MLSFFSSNKRSTRKTRKQIILSELPLVLTLTDKGDNKKRAENIEARGLGSPRNIKIVYNSYPTHISAIQNRILPKLLKKIIFGIHIQARMGE
jgi:hypothetical protein